MRQSIARSWKALAKERLEDQKPTIPLGPKFWALSRAEREAINELFATPPLRHLSTSLRSRDDDAAVEVLDAAYWMKGCSSLGLLRFAVLLGVEKRDLGLMDIKEAIKAAVYAMLPGKCRKITRRASSRVRSIYHRIWANG
jgi:uncharacterized protein (DUF2252 family)